MRSLFSHSYLHFGVHEKVNEGSIITEFNMHREFQIFNMLLVIDHFGKHEGKLTLTAADQALMGYEIHGKEKKMTKVLDHALLNLYRVGLVDHFMRVNEDLFIKMERYKTLEDRDLWQTCDSLNIKTADEKSDELYDFDF
jgi:hypothetical protein